ncbi:MAG: CaiB/BaiF CoA-transferase family protein [Acidimicrobiales bacterium]
MTDRTVPSDPARRVDPREPVLAGVTVVDLSQYLAGPTCTRMLVELGADVIKIEVPPYGDPGRSFAPRKNQRAGFHVQQNRGKRSVCVDLGTVEGVEVVRRLIAKADIVVENFSPGVMARKGLSYDELSADHPGLIMVSISGFGQTGPLASKPAFDFIAQAYSGIMHMTGETDGPPLFVGIGLADSNAGVHAFAAIGHALFRRERTGRGTHLDISMVDSLVHMHETAVYAPSITDGAYEPIRQGRFYQPAQPGGVYRGPQGWIVIFCTQGQLGNLWTAMGHPEFATDPRFDNNEARLANRDALTDEIETWLASFESDAAALAVLDEHRVPASRVNSPADLAASDHLRFRGSMRTVHDPRLGSVDTPGFPLVFAGDDAPRVMADDVVAPNLGQHNREVLAMAGYNDDEIEALEAAGTLGSKDR